MGNNRLPWDVKQQCLWIVRGYDRTRREYLKARREILEAGGENYVTYTENGESRREYLPTSHNATRTVESITLKLEALEKSTAFRQMRAVEHARARIGNDLPEMLADMLRDAIMLNCQRGREYPYERLYVAGIIRKDFYARRNAFLEEIAEELGLF